MSVVVFSYNNIYYRHDGEESRSINGEHKERRATGTSRYGKSRAVVICANSLQELGSMYDYLAKIVLLGPSGAGKYVVAIRTMEMSR